MPPKKKKPSKKPPNKKPIVTILPTNNKFYPVLQKNYSDLIMGPKAADFASIRNEINEYEKALDGKPSTVVLTATPPFGQIYFHPTGEKCIDTETGKTVPRFIVVDAHKKSITLAKSAERDFNNVDEASPSGASSNPLKKGGRLFDNNVGKRIGMDGKCVPVTIKTINSEGKADKETQFVSISDSKKISPDIRMKESMDNMKTDLENELDGGQQIFIGSVVVLGLYLFFKVLYKPVR
jgi:hypothetical protein